MKWGKSVCVIALGLLLSLLPASAHDIKAELKLGLAAARTGDYVAARASWLPLARHGSAEAQFNLGWLCETGLGLEKNQFQAAKWYAKAAAQGHESAQYNLGIIYTQGQGVLRDDTTAASYFRLAAMQGHAKAAYNLSRLYQSGRGVAKDLNMARYWFGRAKAKGLIMAKRPLLG